MIARIVILCTAVLGTSCVLRDSEPVEVVMCPGDVIEYRESGGRSLKVSATSRLEREYLVGDGLRFTVDLTPRHKRWYGSRGITRSSGTDNTHFVLEEAVQHFSSLQEAREWLAIRAYSEHGWVSAVDESGLLMTWKYELFSPAFQSAQRAALSVDVYQILVNLERPTESLKVSDDVLIKNLTPSCDAQKLEPGYAPSKPAILNGRLFSGRALDFMREHGYKSDDVEKAIANGKKVVDGTETQYHPKPFDKLPSVAIDADGRVMRVYR